MLKIVNSKIIYKQLKRMEEIGLYVTFESWSFV